jgi:hypothetical protein
MNLRDRATANTAQGTRINSGWFMPVEGALGAHTGTMGIPGRPWGHGATWVTYKNFHGCRKRLISRGNQKLHEKSEPMVLRSAGDSAIITTESQ